jgi:hypothetical protein
VESGHAVLLEQRHRRSPGVWVEDAEDVPSANPMPVPLQDGATVTKSTPCLLDRSGTASERSATARRPAASSRRGFRTCWRWTDGRQPAATVGRGEESGGELRQHAMGEQCGAEARACRGPHTAGLRWLVAHAARHWLTGNHRRRQRARRRSTSCFGCIETRRDVTGRRRPSAARGLIAE